jgi:hypothetical protein
VITFDAVQYKMRRNAGRGQADRWSSVNFASPAKYVFVPLQYIQQPLCVMFETVKPTDASVIGVIFDHVLCNSSQLKMQGIVTVVRLFN